MSDDRHIAGRVWPRRGILATAAGRRVAATVMSVTGISFVVGAVATITAVGVAGAFGWLLPHTVIHVSEGLIGAVILLGGAFLALPWVARLAPFGDDVRLLELCDPGAPLLHDLLDAAPGTYHHSIFAGSMAAAAAHEIGADMLLARVGAYYHDIGKSRRPQFFIENQLGIHNPHDAAPPEQSAFIITAHVREGVQLAERARLPKPVIDIIAQHHGTSIVACFYGKAVTGGHEVDEKSFRYDGCIPQTREAALVMLADSAEAAARALVDCGPVQIEAAVRRIVESKIADGQLARSGMTEEDIEEAVAVFSRMLSSQRHARVPYPDTSERA